MSAADLTSLCNSLETAAEYHQKDFDSARPTCELWAELQPRTKVEEVPFERLMIRLVDVSPTDTDFARYRGTELKSGAQGKLFDATIIPNDVGKDVACTVLQAHLGDDELYKYECSINTTSYPVAVQLEDKLVSSLGGLGLVEDQISEHGSVVKDNADNECAPTGECTHTHMYVSAIKDGKIVDIEAHPTFIRNGAADIEMLMTTGHHNFVEGVASDSGTVTFSVYSHRTHGDSPSSVPR